MADFFAPVAIVGRACVLPGALRPEALWEAVVSGSDLLSHVDAERWDLPHRLAMSASHSDSQERTWTDRGGYVRGFAQHFQPDGLLVDPAQVAALDPLFHWVVHCGRLALAEAGYQPGQCPRSGLILGNLSFPTTAMAQVAQRTWLSAQADRFFHKTALDLAQLAEVDLRNRFSSGLPALWAGKALGCQGRSFALDAACASSLYAIALACDALHDGQAEVMLAGGVNRADDLFIHVGFCALNAMSQSGQSRPFHRHADGLVPAEGAVIFALKRLRDALDDGNRIYGVIRGLGLSNDGRGRGFLAPLVDGQERAMRRAYARSGLQPADISLLECHATGTVAGDRAELDSSARVFAGLAEVPIGSLKSNIGHLITAAGGAGLLKVLLAMEHGIRPPTLHVDDPTPALAGTPFRLLAQAEEWDVPHRRAAVSAFGFGGNNAHLIVEALAPSERAGKRRAPVAAKRAPASTSPAIALVGLGMRVANCDHTAAVVQALRQGSSHLSRRSDGTLAGLRAKVSIPTESLRFPPRDLHHTLPQQLLLLEAALEAIDAVGALPRERCSVLIGMGCDPEIARYGTRWRLRGWAEKWQQAGVDCDQTWLDSARDALIHGLEAAGVIGTMPNIPANRLNSQFDMWGPSFSISAETLSGLVAVQLAVRALRQGEIDAALVGAVDLSCEPVHEQAASAHLPTPVQIPGDAAVALVLKRADDAIRAGLDIIALVDAPAQQPASLTFGPEPPATSLIPQFGYAHAASALVHLACSALAIKHRIRPQGVGRPCLPWLADTPISAAVKHTAMTGASQTLHLAAAPGSDVLSCAGDKTPAVHVFSGTSRQAVAADLRAGRESDDGPVKVAFVAEGPDMLPARCQQALAKLQGHTDASGLHDIYVGDGPVAGEVALVFTGAAAAYPQMGRELVSALPELGTAVHNRMGGSRAAANWVYRPDCRELTVVDTLWGASFLCQFHAELTMGLLRLQPDALVGYSSGESNALFAAGIWTDMPEMIAASQQHPIFTSALVPPFTAVRAAWRAAGLADGTWANWCVRAPVGDVERYVAAEPQVHVTAINGDSDCVIGGHHEACERVIARIGKHHVYPLGYPMAVHCPEVQEVREAWIQLHTRACAPVEGMRVYTHATGQSYRPTQAESAAAIYGQAVKTLDFRAMVEQVWQDGGRIFIEHGPRDLCTGWIRDHLGQREHLAVALDHPGPHALRHTLASVAQLIAAGVTLDWRALNSKLSRRWPVPAQASTLSFEAHMPSVRLPSVPQRAPASAPVQRMAPAPWLPPMMATQPADPATAATQPVEPATAVAMATAVAAPATAVSPRRPLVPASTHQANSVVTAVAREIPALTPAQDAMTTGAATPSQPGNGVGPGPHEPVIHASSQPSNEIGPGLHEPVIHAPSQPGNGVGSGPHTSVIHASSQPGNGIGPGPHTSVPHADHGSAQEVGLWPVAAQQAAVPAPIVRRSSAFHRQIAQVHSAYVAQQAQLQQRYLSLQQRALDQLLRAAAGHAPHDSATALAAMPGASVSPTTSRARAAFTMTPAEVAPDAQPASVAVAPVMHERGTAAPMAVVPVPSPVPRSPVPRSPLPKSPVPKSPVPKSPVPAVPVAPQISGADAAPAADVAPEAQCAAAGPAGQGSTAASPPPGMSAPIAASATAVSASMPAGLATTSPGDGAAVAAEGAVSALPAYDRQQLETLASGRISDVFGPLFAQQDGYIRQVRMPEPPLLLADRVTGIAAEPGILGRGSIYTETDVGPDAWYLHDGRMPAGIMIESGQADLLLISWMGVDFLNKSERVYRLLGCELTYHGPLPEPGDTLKYDIHIDGHAHQGDVRLFFFHYNCHIGDSLRLSVRSGQAGFFTDEELKQSMGVLWAAETAEYDHNARVDAPAVVCQRRAFDRAHLEAFADGDLLACMGPGFERGQSHVHTPRISSGQMLFLQRITDLDTAGGPWQRGYLRAEDDIGPEHWFFGGHFKNDPCMPGTLMFEGCLQTMAFYLSALGYTLDRDGWRFEPVPEEKYLMRCRGQVTPEARKLVYELFVEEVIDGPQPTLYADLLCTVDGLKAFHCRRMGLRLVPSWPLERRRHLIDGYREPKPVAEVDGFAFGYPALLASAWGRPSAAFGPAYQRFDGVERAPRLPGPPLHFVSRICRVDGVMGAMQPGSLVEAEYDIPSDAWYFAANGAATMPFCVALEAALQPCGWLASFVGCALGAQEELVFLNLDGTATLTGEIWPDTGTLVTQVTNTRIDRSAGMIIVAFEVVCSAAGRVIFTIDTSFGFFPWPALQKQIGISPAAQMQALCDRDAEGYEVDLSTAGHRFADHSAALATGDLLLLDRITGYWPQGPSGRPQLRAEKRVNGGDWFFKAHFFENPIMPGSLGLEAVLQLLQFYMLESGMAKDIRHGRFEPIALDTAITWKYRGMIRPENHTVVIAMEIGDTGRDERGVFALAEASVFVDDMCIYRASEVGMRVVSGSPAAVDALSSTLPAASDRAAAGANAPPAVATAGRENASPAVATAGRENAPPTVATAGREDASPAVATAVREFVLSLDRQPWLRDHCPTWTLPTVPMMSMVDLLAEATSAQLPQAAMVVGLRNIQIHRWVVLRDGQELSCRTEVDRGAAGVYQARLLIWRQANDPALSRYEVAAAGEVLVSENYAGEVPPELAPLGPTEPMVAPYESGLLFHGPAFQMMTQCRLGAAGATAIVDVSRGSVPVGVLNPGLLDAATHSIPHERWHVWTDEISAAWVAYPYRIGEAQFFGPAPVAGVVRCEVRFDGFDGGTRFPACRIQLIQGGKVWAMLRLTEIALPKGPIGEASPDQRRMFMRDRVPVSGLGLSRCQHDSTQTRLVDIKGSDWLPGTVAHLYGMTAAVDAATMAPQIAVKDHIAYREQVHPSTVSLDQSTARCTHFPLTRFPVAVTAPGESWIARTTGAEYLDLSDVIAYHRDAMGIGPWFIEDLYYGLVRRFVRRLVLADPAGFAAVRGRSILYLANHQIGIESLLFSVLVAGLSQVPTVTLAKIEHQNSWLGKLIAHGVAYPGVADPGLITFFDRANRESLMQIIGDLRRDMVSSGRSVMVHIEGTRSLSCRQPVQKMSSAFIDMALAVDAPIVPVRFVGGLPAAPVTTRLEFPLDFGTQDYWLGAPILPETLAAAPYAERKQMVIAAINQLGPANAEETPHPGDPGFAARVNAWMNATGVDEDHAVLFETLAGCAQPIADVAELVAKARQGTPTYPDTPIGRWLREMATRLCGSGALS